VPFHLGHYATGATPTIYPIEKISVSDHRRMRRAAHRSGQQMLDLPLQHVVSWQTDDILIAFRLKKFIYLRVGKGGIGPKVTGKILTAIPSHYRLQYGPPVFGAVHVAFTQHGMLHVAQLVKQNSG